MVLSKNAKLANKQKSTFDKANKNNILNNFSTMEGITQISNL